MQQRLIEVTENDYNNGGNIIYCTLEIRQHQLQKIFFVK
jgi:hypothetical protein